MELNNTMLFAEVTQLKSSTKIRQLVVSSSWLYIVSIYCSSYFYGSGWLFPFLMVQLLREISHENVVKLVNVHINQADMSLYLAFDYAEHDLYVSFSVLVNLMNKLV